MNSAERWLGNTNSATGSTQSGNTPDDPIDATTFQAILAGSDATWKAGTNLTLHLLPLTNGTYTVSGNTTIPDGLRLLGSNATNTVIRQTSATSSGSDYWVLGWAGSSDNSSVYISDVTLDAGWNGARTAAGVSMASGSGTLERVRVINFGTSGALEVDPISWFVPSTGNGQVLIQDCMVQGAVKGTPTQGGSAIEIHGGSSSAVQGTNALVFVRNNHISNLGAMAGVGLYAANNVLIDGNTIAGLSRGVAIEWGSSTNVQILNNIFENVREGISIGDPTSSSTYTYDGVMIANNLVEIESNQPYLDSSMVPAGIRITGGVVNSTVKNNLLQVMPAYRSAYDSTKYGFDIYSNNSSVTNSNLILTGNAISPMVNNFFQSYSAISFASLNHTIDGKNFDIFPPSNIGMSSTSLSFDITPSLHQWVDNMWVSTSLGGTNTIFLPDPVNFEGRSYRLFITVPPIASSTTVAIQCSSNTYCSGCPSIWDVKTQTGFSTTQSVVIGTWPASSNYPLTPVTVTSIGGGWKLER